MVAVGNIADTVLQGAGGIAYVGIYDLTQSSTANQSGSYYKPALVFPSRLGNAKNTAEAASHEAGHNLNLSHDGTSTAAYYTGGGSSPGWAPIMGVGYDEPLVQFSRGEYSGASNIENDFLKITGEGVGRYTDGLNINLDSASTVTLDSTGYGGIFDTINLMSDNGLAAADSDFFKVIAPGTGTLTISVNNALIYTKDGGISYIGSDLPAGYGNIHLDAQILNSAGTSIADWATNNTQDVTSLSADVLAGQTYYVKVMPNASLSDQTIGETTWGSLGDYALRIQAPVGTDTTAPTISGITVQGTQVFLQFANTINIAGLTTARFAATVGGLTRAISSVALVSGDPTRLALTLSSTAPTSSQAVGIRYTDLTSSDDTIGVIQSNAGTDLATMPTPRNADTFNSATTVTSLASSYNNLALTGTLAINGTGNANGNTITGNNAVNVITGAAGIDTMNGGELGDIFIVASAIDHNGAEINDTGTTGTDELRFSSTTTGQTLNVYANDVGLENVVVGTGTTSAAATTTGLTALNVNAAAAPNGLVITGNNGINTLTGTASADTINGNSGNDTANGGGGE